MNQEHESRNYL